ncbi:hypothetical protein HK101_001668 [Irineochytrium annulatum]|nr:hypothetical protein HK101_001668 [Irineochytrium annulatum]
MVSLAAPRRINGRPARLAAANVSATDGSVVDPCTTLHDVGPADDILACFSQFPVTNDQRADQIDTIKRFFEVYSFLELAKTAAPPLIPSDVDILALLDRIAADDSITTEISFHTKIAEALQTLNDPHVIYNPNCFTQPFFYQPWVVSSLYDIDTGKQTIAIRDLVVNSLVEFRRDCDTPLCASVLSRVKSFWSVNATDKFNPADYVNWTIAEINGVDAMDFVQDLGDYYGRSKTPESRFNSVLAGYQIAELGSANASNQQWAVTNNALYVRSTLQLRTDTTDGRTTISYFLVSPDGTSTAELNVPWVAFLPPDAYASLQKGKDAYYSSFCVSPPRSNVAVGNGTTPAVTSKHSRRPKISERATSKKKFHAKSKAAAVSPDVKHPISTYPLGAFYNLDGTTGAWIFSTVEAPPGNDDLAWGRSIVEGLDNLKKSGVKNLIIDVTGNGGGTICIGYGLAITLDVVLPHYDFRLSETSHAILEGTPDAASIFTASAINSLAGGNLTDAQLEVGGSPGRSAQFLQNCRMTGFDFEAVLNATRPEGSWDGLALVSNGVCGSTCATFTRILRHQNTTMSVPSFTYGGNTFQAFQPDSFEGGSISQFSAILHTVQGIVANHTKGTFPILEAWTDLPLPAEITLPVWAAYSPLSALPDAPSEFVSEPSDGYIAVADPLDSFSIYQGVIAQMGW